MSGTDTKAVRILLLEDEHAVRELARLILDHEGWEIVQAGSLTEAAECVRTKKRPFDLFIVDICLPDGFGTQLVEKMRQTGADPMVIYMTGDPGWLRRLGAEGAALLQKPFTPLQLIQAVQQALA
ncbi:MAG: response regulator [Bryobacteraceae bacterium]